MPSLRLHAPGRRVGVLIGLFAVVLASVAMPAPAAAVDGFLVVVHPDVPERSLERERLAKLFLKKVVHWADGTEVIVFEPLRDSPTYEAFAREIYGRSVQSIEAYWQRMLFGGKAVPPDNLEEHHLLETIAATPGSIGFVARDTILPYGVIRLEVEGFPDDVPLAAGAVGADAEPTAVDAVVRGPAAMTVQSHLYDLNGEGSVVLFDVGPCEDEARRFAVSNRGRATVAVRLQVSRWLDGQRRASTTRRLVLEPGAEETLGCSVRGREERRWAITEVDVGRPVEGYEGGDRRAGRSGILAREAVGWVEGGSCGAGGEGTLHVLRNRVLDRSVSVQVEIQQQVPGSSRTHTRTVTLRPGGEQRFGCSIDGKLRRTVTVLSAEYR